LEVAKPKPNVMTDGNNNRDDLFSKSIRAGKRTYFFDVKTTKGNDLYMTITESKRRYSDDGRQQYQKHKLFLYKEDFDKFLEGLQETIDRIYAIRDSHNYDDRFNRLDNNEADYHEEHSDNERDSAPSPSPSVHNIDFDDLED
jgi:hypothetical protein